MLSAIILCVVLLNAIKLSVIMLNIVTPDGRWNYLPLKNKGAAYELTRVMEYTAYVFA